MTPRARIAYTTRLLFVAAATPAAIAADAPCPASSPAPLIIDAGTLLGAASTPVDSDAHMRVVSGGAPRVSDVTGFESADRRLVVDVSHYDRLELQLRDWPVDELMILLSGRIEIADAAGRTRIYDAGDVFLMPAGFAGTWRELSPISKIAVSYEPQPVQAHAKRTTGALAQGPRAKASPTIYPIEPAALTEASASMSVMTPWEPYLTITGRAGSYVELPRYRSPDRRFAVQLKRFEPMNIALSDWPLD